jgi:hypothetical protein
MDRQQNAGDDNPRDKQPEPLDLRVPGVGGQPGTMGILTGGLG